ncbi:MAG: hypothetical protein ABFC56_14110 [Clostridiaceae bacterium]
MDTVDIPEVIPARIVDITAQVRQLNLSERGAQAARDFAKLLNNGAYGLDCGNWGALADLVAVCRAGNCPAVMQALKGGRA